MTVVMAMSELVTRVDEMPVESHSLVVTEVESMKQLSMIKMLYEVMRMGPLKSREVTMHIVVDENTRRNAGTLLVPNLEITLWAEAGIDEGMKHDNIKRWTSNSPVESEGMVASPRRRAGARCGA